MSEIKKLGDRLNKLERLNQSKINEIKDDDIKNVLVKATALIEEDAISSLEKLPKSKEILELTTNMIK